MNRGSRLTQAARGVCFGLPIPICSCGVLPVYETLMKRGVAPTAGLAFLIATPELGIDALLLSIPLLGSELTVARLVAAVIVALAAGYLLGRLMPTNQFHQNHGSNAQTSLLNRLKDGLKYGLIDLVDHTLPWIILGLGIAAMVEPILSPETMKQLPSWLQVPAFALLGIPLYVCASGATPLAAVAIHKGISAGAALAFLLTGPATNATTFGILKQLHGKRIAILFGVVVCGLAIGLGWTIDAVISSDSIGLHETAEEKGSMLQWVCVGGLIVLGISSLIRQGSRGFVDQITHPIHSH